MDSGTNVIFVPTKMIEIWLKKDQFDLIRHSKVLKGLKIIQNERLLMYTDTYIKFTGVG